MYEEPFDDESLFEYESLFERLSEADMGEWVEQLRPACKRALQPESHGLLADWIAAWNEIPVSTSPVLKTSDGFQLSGPLSTTQTRKLEAQLRLFHPWRKGPFQLFGIHVDTEWRSDWKWERLQDHVEFRDRLILDVGCGNGYYGWRMLGAGAETVVGLDPFLLYVMQHEAIKQCVGPEANYVLPLGDSCLSAGLGAFDVTLAMGVLYHRSNPIEHLKVLHDSLKPGGQFVVETLIVDGDRNTVLVPDGRYAKMRNVWFLPSVDMLQVWLRRSGFRDIKVIDVSRTSTEEQRPTDWMTFESLPQFLNADASATIEGYPPPVRALLTARRR